MALNDNHPVALDDQPLARPVGGPPGAGLPWDEVDDELEGEEGDDAEVALLPEETTQEVAEEEDDEEDAFVEDERDPFARLRASTPVEPAAPVEQPAEEGSDERAPITLDGAVYARIAECLRTAIAEADERLVQARELAAREPFYAGYIDVLEGQRRRYATALERTLPLAGGMETTGGSEAQPAEDATEA
jgi:hypothetical protein